MPGTRGRRRPKQQQRHTPFVVAIAAVLAAGLLAFVWAMSGPKEQSRPEGPFIGTDMVAGVEVRTPSVDLGRQPLDQPVSHTFVVTNTNDRIVQLGKARIEVLDGC